MTQILGLSAKKSGGKTTGVNFIFGMTMMNLVDTDENGVERPALITGFRVDEQGLLRISTHEFQDGLFDPVMPVSPAALQYCIENIYPYVKMYYMADKLKQDVCMKVLGLTYEQCYGSEDDKNTYTKLRWENMPGVFVLKQKNKTTEKLASDLGMITHAPGFMTAREVMQFVGTDVFRKMYADVWVDSTVRQIQAEGSELALIGDIRFPNEVEGVRKAGGKVVRLTRNVLAHDAHASETALDNYPADGYDYVLDNQNMNIDEQNQALYAKLVEWGYFTSPLERV